MATIHVDGKQFEVDGADNLLQACLSLGLDIPYFCWHPALGSVGACRQCAVKQYANADDTRGRLVMSCMTPATDGTIISVTDEEAKAFREGVIEWLMINHPHDCPVCEEGGACHLQDMTVMTGHSNRHYRFTKRTHQNQDLGPFINHEMNRCIACYRCVRYYKDYAGGTDLGVYGAHDNVYFGRETDGVLESEFSGNLVEVCPTGVFTDRTHSSRFNRKWDMQFAPSICQQCSVGCNISPGERYGELRRIENRYNGSVNHYFLCDRGRFGYGYVNNKDRPNLPVNKAGHDRTEPGTGLGLDEAIETAAAALKSSKRVIGIGSPRATLESNYALRTLVGEDHFFSGISAAESQVIGTALKILNEGPVPTPSLRDIESYDAVIVLGEDVTQTAPRIALALREASRNKAKQMAEGRRLNDWQAEAIQNIGQRDKSPIFIAAVTATRIDDLAEETFFGSPEDIARLGFAVAHLINADAPAVTDANQELLDLAARIAAALKQAGKPLIVSGTSLNFEPVLQAAANISRALHHDNKDTGISLAFAEVNSAGLGMFKAPPLDEALALLETWEADAVVVLENDLYRRAPSDVVDNALSQCQHIVVVDHQQTATTDKATLLLPAASFAETDGTVVSQEGRAQKFFQTFEPTYFHPDSLIRDSWRWLRGIESEINGQAFGWDGLDDVTAACANGIAGLAAITGAGQESDYRFKGLKIARSPRRYSGRTSQRANLDVHEPRAVQDSDSPLAFSMEGYAGTEEPSPLIPFAWSPGWNSPQAWNKFQDEVGGHLRQGDPGVRMFSPGGTAGTFYSPCEALVIKPGDWRIVPTYHLFGSEEMSSRSEVVQSRLTPAYVGLSQADATALQVVEGAPLLLTFGTRHATLAVKILPGLNSGLLALPVGVAGVPVVSGTDKVCVAGVQA
jgi:NADH-quinone oxidoreductase subunit G